MSAWILVPCYLIVTLAPLVLAWAGARPPRSVWDELASGAGMLAFVTILVEFVLSGRFRTISRRVGMDVTMRVHQLTARTALALALLHPFLYQAPFAPDRPWDLDRQLTLTVGLGALWSGIAGWVLLALLVVLAVGRDRLHWRYETWRLTHGLGAVAVAGLLLHHTLAAGRYSQDPVLASVWTALFTIALLSVIYIYLVKPILELRRPWTVQEVRRVGLRTWELTLGADGHAGLRYEAGQFVWLNLGHSPFSVAENPFSISSAPGSGPQLQFVIKELGDLTRTIGRTVPGTRAYVDGPFGNLTVAGRREAGIALIAGGVGLAPLIGILRQLRLEGDPRPTMLVYGNRVEDQILYRPELEALARDHGTRIEHALSEPPPGWAGHTGWVDGPLIARLFEPRMTAWLFVLCGPGAMMQSVEDALIACGVPARQILSERFDYE